MLVQFVPGNSSNDVANALIRSDQSNAMWLGVGAGIAAIAAYRTRNMWIGVGAVVLAYLSYHYYQAMIVGENVRDAAQASRILGKL